MDKRMEPVTIRLDAGTAEPLSAWLFGHNLEHTRAAVNGGLSAQMLRNRKFAGKPSLTGVAAEWEGIGDRAFFQTGGESYTRHIGCGGMQRRNELQSMSAQNLRGAARLTANGQIFALMRGHHGGKRRRIAGADAFAAAATERDGVVYVTLVNDSYDESRAFVLDGVPGDAEGVLLTAEEVIPCTYFQETGLPVEQDGANCAVSLPPHSVAAVRIRLK